MRNILAIGIQVPRDSSLIRSLTNNQDGLTVIIRDKFLIFGKVLSESEDELIIVNTHDLQEVINEITEKINKNVSIRDTYVKLFSFAE